MIMRTHNTMTNPPTATIPVAHRRGRAGLTLIELMVASSILIILVLAVSQILSSAQRVVNIGHANMRSNGKVGALRNIVRDDFRRITPTGFLYLDDEGFLVFTTAGPVNTMTPETSGDSAATLASYGRRDYNGAEPNEQVLNRVSVLANGVGLPANVNAGTLTNDSDASPYDLAHFQGNYFTNSSATGADIVEAVVARIKNTYFPGDKMNLLQQDLTLGDITNDSWKVMTPRVTGLEFFWTDGTVEVNGGIVTLVWYGGKDGKRKSNPNNPADPWLLIESGGKFDPGSGAALIDTGASYQVRWTNETDPKHWPKAIKMVITINDDAMKDFKGRYEIICPVGP